MPQVFAALPAIFSALTAAAPAIGAVSGGVGLGEGIANMVGGGPGTPTLPLTPNVKPMPVGPTQPQVASTQSNFQANTGGSLSPGALSQLLEQLNSGSAGGP